MDGYYCLFNMKRDNFLFDFDLNYHWSDVTSISSYDFEFVTFQLYSPIGKTLFLLSDNESVMGGTKKDLIDICLPYKGFLLIVPVKGYRRTDQLFFKKAIKI